MSKVHQLENWALQTNKPSLFNRFGHRLGSIFLFAKNKAKDKYLEVTSGINHRIEEEEQLIRQETEFLLMQQASEYEAEIRRLKKRGIFYAFIISMISAIIASVVVFFYL